MAVYEIAGKIRMAPVKKDFSLVEVHSGKQAETLLKV
jgi:hypothetical protein